MMERGETFCNIFVVKYTQKIPCFVSKKTNQKSFDWFLHLKHVFVSYISCLVQPILKRKFGCLLKLISKRIPRKTRFFVLGRPLYSIKIKLVQPFFIKFIKMNSWMSKLSSDTKLSMPWTKFDFDIQVDLFIELPIYLQQTSVQIIMAANFSLHVF